MARETAYATPSASERARLARGDVSAPEVGVSRPSGPAAAVLLAAGLGSFTLGLLSILAATSGWVSDTLTLSDRVGELSGVTTVSVIVFFGTWAVLGLAWRRADPPLERIAAVAGVLIALGLLGTFPPFVNAVT